ncbi:hypothetical protein AB0B28_17515 [Glycomyces sp. NPDC046736]|uniref:hypothetical protein n=1 Tax=Glycomyces sp. NPDC046736 TaxID=3155615 RepID=UPI0033CB13BE
MTVTLTMPPDAARQLITELSERSEHLGLAAEMLTAEAAEAIEERRRFLGFAIDNLKSQLHKP